MPARSNPKTEMLFKKKTLKIKFKGGAKSQTNRRAAVKQLTGWAGEVASRAVVYAVGAAELDNVGDRLFDARLRFPAFALVLFSVFVNVPAAVGALAGGLVAAEVAVDVVDVSAAAGFSGAEGFSICVVRAAADWLDVDRLSAISDASIR